MSKSSILPTVLLAVADDLFLFSYNPFPVFSFVYCASFVPVEEILCFDEPLLGPVLVVLGSMECGSRVMED